MSSLWVEAVCTGCKEPLEDRDKTVAIVPCTMKEKVSYASGSGNRHKPGAPKQLRVMPGKGRKDQQKPEVYHERCWPGVRTASGK